MKRISIFNHVLGPVMRGPSSSHTAGAYHIASVVRSLAGGTPARVSCAFDPGGSYARTYSQQGADRAFAMGLMGRPLTEEAFFRALDLAPSHGLDLRFEVRPIPGADHPNQAHILAQGADGRQLDLMARSIGGGDFDITRLNGWPVRCNGCAFDLAVEVEPDGLAEVQAGILRHGYLLGAPALQKREAAALVTASRSRDGAELLAWLRALPRVRWACQAAPVYFIQPGAMLFHSAAEMEELASAGGLSLGELAARYEAQLLGLEPDQVEQEMLRRYAVMEQAVRRGLDPDFEGMQLLEPSAGRVFQAQAQGPRKGRLSLGGPHLRAAARAMAVMHVNGAMGVVCAAPTGGAAGTLPGAMVTLAEERALEPRTVARALLAAGAVGVIVAQRATFAAEVAGCQVEIGAAGAMAAAAVVDAVGGSAAQACAAAAIAFQNTMGSVCDLVQGMVEIPCHTRNAVAAANAFLCADLVLGGYANPIPLDETIDAVYAVGRMLPAELRCTARGGLALAPSAQALKPRGACQECRS
jgi:L-serine dehydratase